LPPAPALTAEELTAVLGARFVVRGGPFDATSLTLAGVQDHGTAQGYERFSILFEGPPEPTLPQATYELESDRFGAQAIFLVPAPPRGGCTRYEAVFSRLIG
jgi:hypothetical protein